ncbi:MAG: hypothetical protein IJF07_02115 [Lachnospiraceae bacterium]|nr:hypothetical protein [Lachnospiraceae bacterium]
MRNLITKWVLLFLTIVMLGTVTGCTSREKADTSIKETSSQMSQSKETQVGENEVQESSQVSEMTEKDSSVAIQYGDTIQASLLVQECEGVVEELGEMEIVVTESSEPFLPWPDASKAAAQKDVQKVIGKYVGDEFTIGYEGGDSYYFYEYKIIGFAEEKANTVSYGDRIQTTYINRVTGVDVKPPYEESTGEAEFIVSVLDNRFDAIAMSYYRHRAERNVAQAIGKGVSDKFYTVTESSENTIRWEYTVTGIDKAVEYGDKILVSCRCTSFSTETPVTERNYENIELPLHVDSGTFTLAEYELPHYLTKELLQKMMGQKAGDTVWVHDYQMGKSIGYGVSVMEVQPTEQESFDEAAFWLAEEENIEYYHGAYHPYYPELVDVEAYYDPFYAVVVDAETRTRYEYYLDEGAPTLECKYPYQKECDEKGNVLLEIIGTDTESEQTIYEYQYDANGKLETVKRKWQYASGGEMIYYYNAEGVVYKSETNYADGGKTTCEYEGPFVVKKIRTQADGTVDIEELDGWWTKVN